MRYLFTLILSACIMLTSCAGSNRRISLDYQNSRLYVEGTFSSGNGALFVALTLEAPEFDENGRMLARDAKVEFGEDSIIAGLGFEISAGDAFVTSDDMKMPLHSADCVPGIFDVISLFCILDDSYYKSESVTDEGLSYLNIEYRNGENSAAVLMDTETCLPKRITANIEGRELSYDISLIRSE